MKRLPFALILFRAALAPALPALALAVGDAARPWLAALLVAGLYCNLVSYPACRRRECRLRLCAMKDHSPADIEEAAAILAAAGRRNGVLP